jgi:hypothetical protein
MKSTIEFNKSIEEKDEDSFIKNVQESKKYF